jgi:Flp pilus assembly protein TadD
MMWVDQRAKPSDLVERDQKPAMTPAQQEELYRTCFTQGLKLAREKRYGLALGEFERAVALKPTSAEALFNLGACYEWTGDPLRAINIYRRVLELHPDDADCYANLGTSFIKMYYRDKSPVWRKMAREAWRHSLRLNPEQAAVKQYLARSESID